MARVGAVLSGEPEGVIRLVLADLPSTATRPNLAEARTIGGRVTAAARLKELLPGATFDQAGHGTFKRAGYTIQFTLDGPEPAMVHVEVDRAEGLTALKRVVEKTGWRAVDPDALAFIDLDASRAAGGAVSVTPRQEDKASSSGNSVLFRIMKHAARAGAVVAFVWGSWWWMTRPAAPLPDFTQTQNRSGEFVQRLADVRRRQVAYMNAVAPAFRPSPIVAQLFEFAVASGTYTSGFGMGRFAKPERLSDAEFWRKLQMPAPLPPAFAEPQRGGYEFEFIGETCGPMKNNMSAPADDCDGFIYSARAIDAPGAPKGRLSFALLTQDGKIHYRKDARTPGIADPSVDNDDESSHADLVNLGGAEPTGVMASLRRITTAVLERLMGDKPGSMEVNAAEGNAIRDLRTLAQAENVFDSMMNGAGRFAPPEVLADPKMFAPAKLAPLLPGYFVQPVRMGYTFEFTGPAVPAPIGGFDWINPQYTDFVYVARPAQPGPPGRRTLAVFPDGVVFATAEDRVPTRRDTPLGTQ